MSNDARHGGDILQEAHSYGHCEREIHCPSSNCRPKGISGTEVININDTYSKDETEKIVCTGIFIWKYYKL